MATVRIAQGLNSAAKLAAVARRLRKAPRTILRQIDTSHLEQVMRRHIEDITPIGEGKEGGHLRDQWRTRKDPTEFTMRVELYSLWERASERKQTRLRSVELGSRAVEITVKEDFAFRSNLIIEGYGRGRRKTRRLIRPWVFFQEGDIINRTARAGLNLLGQTKAWLPTQLPALKARVRQTLDDMLSGKAQL